MLWRNLYLRIIDMADKYSRYVNLTPVGSRVGIPEHGIADYPCPESASDKIGCVWLTCPRESSPQFLGTTIAVTRAS
jgi:hypothetical protein